MIIALHQHDNIIECSNGQASEFKTYGEILSFITHGTGLPHYATLVVWSLKDFVPVVLDLLPEIWRKELEQGKRATWEDKGCRYRLYLQRAAGDTTEYKFFGINTGYAGGHNEVNLYELDQFFPDIEEPQTVQGVQALADELEQTFKILGATNVKSLKSPVAVLEENGVLDKLYKNLPDTSKIPSVVKEWAIECDTFAVWQDCYQIGYWDEAYSYDVSSCYPGWAIKLLSLEDAVYTYSEKPMEGAQYGFLRGTLTIDPTHPHAWCSPIVFPSDDSQTCPVGKLKGIFTLDQVNGIVRRGMGKFKLDKGIFIFTKSKYRPFKDVMTQMFGKRQLSPLMSQVAKRVIAGIIGRLGEYHDNQPTPFTNPVYHALIRTRASLQVGAGIIDQGIEQNELIHVNTDGFWATKKLDLPTKADIGQWRFDGVHKVLTLSSRIIRKDDMATEYVNEIKQRLKSSRYENFNLLALIDRQDRIFDDFPKTGQQLLKNKYISSPVVLK